MYHPGEKCEGKVIVDAYKGWQHQGLKLYAFGYVYLNTSAKGVGIMDVMASGLQPIMLLRDEIEIASSGSFADGETIIPFEFQTHNKVQKHALYVHSCEHVMPNTSSCLL